MPKIFYTDRDVEDMVKNGQTTLVVNENVVLTELAYDKAKRLGLQLLQSTADTPPSAPVRPYLNQPVQQTLPGAQAAAEMLPPVDLSNRNILRFSPNASEDELRAAIIETGKLAYQSGLMISNDGNISVKMADGNLLMTPSGVCKGRIRPEDLLVIDMQGKVVKPGADPALQPTSEQPMHIEVYRQRSDVRAVIHTHLIYANALAITVGKIRMDVIPEAAVSFGSVPITDYALPSSPQNADVIRELIREHDVMLIRNHGSLTVGKNLDEAYINLERLEHVSKTLTYAQLLGNINALPPEMLKAIAQISEQAHAAK